MRLAIALILSIASLTAHGLEYEIAIGQSQFCCTQNGIWWQSSFGFTGQTRDLAFEAGVRQRIGDFSIHGAYVDLGSATGLNKATMRDDDFGSYNTHLGCNSASQKNCLGYFAAKQHVAGFLVGASYRLMLKGVGIEPEVGQFLYQADMKIAIWCPNCGTDSRYAFGAGGTFSSTSEIRRSQYLALKVSYKDVFLTYRRFSKIDGGGSGLDGVETQFSTGLTNGPVSQILVGMSF